ncbi:hypothetical protein AR539_18295 [Arthrobacter sp. EPSL27]|nr:hypothetical protein AR539_18295 [Arthrobacter sp. EPSL27]
MARRSADDHISFRHQPFLKPILDFARVHALSLVIQCIGGSGMLVVFNCDNGLKLAGGLEPFRHPACARKKINES